MKFSIVVLALVSATAGRLPHCCDDGLECCDDGLERCDEGLERICPGLKTENNGCIRYTKGFDVTGVITEVDLTFPEVKNKCDCIQECLNRPTTCANYVWKFSTAASVILGHRTCTLYSNFNYPSNVTVDIDLTSPRNKNINNETIASNGNNPQYGAPVPQAFKDVNLNTTADHEAVSGWVQCSYVLAAVD
jgi:hypothetical protein